MSRVTFPSRGLFNYTIFCSNLFWWEGPYWFWYFMFSGSNSCRLSVILPSGTCIWRYPLPISGPYIPRTGAYVWPEVHTYLTSSKISFLPCLDTPVFPLPQLLRLPPPPVMYTFYLHALLFPVFFHLAVPFIFVLHTAILYTTDISSH
jgi:hypothetical protein